MSRDVLIRYVPQRVGGRWLIDGIPIREIVVVPMVCLLFATMILSVFAMWAADVQSEVVANVQSKEELTFALQRLNEIVSITVALVGFAGALTGAGASWAVVRMRLKSVEQQIRDEIAARRYAIEKLDREHVEDIRELRRDLRDRS